MALSRTGRTDINFEHPIRCKTNPGLLFQAAGTALDERSKTDAMAPTVDVAALDAGLLGPADFLERLLEHRAEIAGIKSCGLLVGDQPSDVEWHLLRGNEIATPDLCRIDCKIGGGDVDQPLAEEIRLDAAGAAIGSRRRFVGDMGVDLAREVRDPIRSWQELCASRGRRAAGAAGIRPDIDRHLAAQADDGAVAVTRDLQIAGSLARMIGRKEMLTTILDPFHRTI